jgi:hypothetical protein
VVPEKAFRDALGEEQIWRPRRKAENTGKDEHRGTENAEGHRGKEEI